MKLFSVGTSLLVLLCISACSSKQKDYGYMTGAEYQGRKAITGSLSVGPSGRLSEKAIQTLLSGRIKMPKKISLGIVRLGGHSDGYDFQPLDDRLAREFYSLANWGDRVQSVIPVPQVILPTKVTLDGLRSAAALVQADALLIISPKTATDWDLRVFEENEAKAYTHLEVLLMDTRTGAIPYTFMASQKAVLKKSNKDYSNQELMTRAKLLSEKKAYLEMQPKVKGFLSTAI